MGKHKAEAVKKDGKIIYSSGEFDPPKPGALDPGKYKGDNDYNWYAENRKANERMRND